MIFRTALAYALLRGLLDALMRRPCVKERYMVVILARVFRAARRPVQEVVESMRELSRLMLRLVRPPWYVRLYRRLDRWRSSLGRRSFRMRGGGE